MRLQPVLILSSLFAVVAESLPHHALPVMARESRPGKAALRFQLRADVTDRIFKLDYPDPYYRIASDNTAVLPGSTSRSFYTHHTALTVGVSYLFRR